MTIDILLSCMNQEDISIISRSNIQTNTVVVNQCDRNAIENSRFTNKQGKECQVKFISTTERGLSRSRNMAIRNSQADICQIADDDEELVDDYVDIVSDAFKRYPNAGVIAFGLSNGRTEHDKFTKKEKKINYLSALHISSVQIAFRRDMIVENRITFDNEMGAGTGHGAGEENKFLYDCLRSGIKCYYVPTCILHLDNSSVSSWFSGYNRDSLYWLGWSSKRYMGRPMASIYALYTSITKYNQYKNKCNFATALYSILRGVWQQRKEDTND